MNKSGVPQSTMEYVLYNLPRRAPSLKNLRHVVDFQPRFELDQVILSVVEDQTKIRISPPHD